MKTSVHEYVKIFALLLFVFLLFFSFPSICDGHEATSDSQPQHHEHHHGHDHHHHGHDHSDHVHSEAPSFKYSREANVAQPASQPPPSTRKPRKQMSGSSLWIEALSSTLIISIAPFLILFFVPLNSKREHESLLKVLLSFACGGLLGDAFLHLIPHALEPHSHDHSHGHSHGHGHGHDGHQHSHGSTGTWVLCGILAFLIIEKSVRLMKGDHRHSHSHGDHAVLVANDTATTADDDKAKKEEEDGGGADSKSKESVENDNSDSMSESEDEIQIAGYLNLAADFTHNFTDGLAIGASYLAGEKVGLVTTITILFHEVPHEIGDFAILVQSGCSKKKAMLLQMLTAFGAILGTVLSLISGGGVGPSWVLPFTAGGFIYIAAVSIIPELLSNSTFVQSVKEIFALLAGVFMMVLVAQFE